MFIISTEPAMLRKEVLFLTKFSGKAFFSEWHYDVSKRMLAQEMLIDIQEHMTWISLTCSFVSQS